MRPVMGDILKSKTTGEFYKVKKIKEQIILLQAEKIPNLDSTIKCNTRL